MTDNLEMRLRNMIAVALAALSAACASGRGGGGPYLSPGPLPPLGGDAQRDGRAVPAVPASAAAVARGGVSGAAASSGSGLPDGLVAADGLARLPGALVAGVGPVHGVAVSISLTGNAPAHDEKALISEILGGGPGDSGQTIARALEAASGGKFRLTFSALPALVAPRERNHGASATDLRSLAVSSLRSWTRHLDFRGWDNDGPDGVPVSADDDGVLDFFLMAVESDRGASSLTIREGLPVEGAGRPLETGPIHVLALAPGDDPLLPGIGLVLDAAGLDGGERFFPAGFPRMVSSLARVRLGWVTTRVGRPGREPAPVPAGEAVLVPLRDVPDGGGFWLVENDGRNTYTTRAVRMSSGHYSPTDVKVWQPGQALVLPLTRQLGELGARVVLQGSASPEIRWEGTTAVSGGGAAAPVPVRW